MGRGGDDPGGDRGGRAPGPIGPGRSGGMDWRADGPTALDVAPVRRPRPPHRPAGVVVEPATARRRDPSCTTTLGVHPSLAAGHPRDDGGQARLLRGAHGARVGRRVRGRAPAWAISGLPGVGHGLHRNQSRRLRLAPRAGGGLALEPGPCPPGGCRHAGRGALAGDYPGRWDCPRPGTGRWVAGGLLVDRIASRLRAHLGLAAAGADGGLGARRGDRRHPAGCALPRVERAAHVAADRRPAADVIAASRRGPRVGGRWALPRADRVRGPASVRYRGRGIRGPLDPPRDLPAPG